MHKRINEPCLVVKNQQCFRITTFGLPNLTGQFGVVVNGAGDERVNSRAGQIGHVVTDGLPQLRCFFEIRSCVAQLLSRGEGPHRSLPRVYRYRPYKFACDLCLPSFKIQTKFKSKYSIIIVPLKNNDVNETNLKWLTTHEPSSFKLWTISLLTNNNFHTTLTFSV